MSKIPVLDIDRENGTGRYYAYWTDKRRSRRKSMGTTDPSVAKQRFGQWLALGGDKIGTTVGLDGNAQVAPKTVGDLWFIYFNGHVLKNAISAPQLRGTWTKLEPHFGHLLPIQITQDVVDAYIGKRTAGRMGPAVALSSARRELSVLRAALNYCAAPKHRSAYLSKGDVPAFDLPPPPKPRSRWLRIDEMQMLLNAAAAARRGPRLSRVERFLWIALETAARSQAILELTWDRVDFETSTIHLPVPGQHDARKRRADVSISKSLRPILERAYAERRTNRVLDSHGNIWDQIQQIVVDAGLGGKQQTTAERRAEVARYQGAGLKPPVKKPLRPTGISAHTLRHTAATHMARRGVPLWKIAKVLGNTLQVVEHTYAKWCPDDPSGTVDMISGGMLEAAE